MEANRKRSRGFLKAKLAPSYKGPKPFPTTTVQYTTTTTTEVKPNQYSSPSPPSVGFVVHQDYAISRAKPNPKVTTIVADSRVDLRSLEEFYGVPADESVDTKAGLYISMIQERLTRERVNNTEPKKFQEN